MAGAGDDPLFFSSAADSGSGGGMNVAVLGMGAFGTAMAVLAARTGHNVRVFARDASQRDAINNAHRNPRAKSLEEFPLPECILAVATVEEACTGAAIVIHALPAQMTPDFIREHRSHIPADAVFCSTSKGLYLARKCLLSEAMLEAFDRAQPLAVLSGPSFAKQILQGFPTVVVVASRLLYHAVTVQRALSSHSFRIYTSQDLVGVELGGALKNPLAIGAGMIEGLGLGINTMAAFLTRACRELQLLCEAMGGKRETVNGLTGIGDLMLTAFGDLSRNRTCGMRLANGDKLEDILAATTVEGVPTAEVAMHFAKTCKLDLPIFAAASGILAGTTNPKEAAKIIMDRPLGIEAPSAHEGAAADSAAAGRVPDELPAETRVAVIGMGAFGTAVAVLAARKGHEVRVFARDAAQRDAINSTHRNPNAKTLEKFDLSHRIVAVASVEEACAGASIVMHALPAQKTPDFIRENRSHIPSDAVFCSAAKGLYFAKKCLLSEAMLEAFGREQPLAVLSGPSFAKQIVQEFPTVVVVAAQKLSHAVRVQHALSNTTFRIYTSQDLVGVELGGALKNPLAIGAGMIEGAGYGINTMCAYLTRACRELRLICTAMGGQPETVNGLSGIGDLMLTAFGDLSRNRTCGMRLAKDEKLADILATATVEGVPTAEVAMHFAKICNLELPIFGVVSGILNGTIKPQDAPKLIMSRPLSTESPLA